MLTRLRVRSRAARMLTTIPRAAAKRKPKSEIVVLPDTEAGIVSMGGEHTCLLGRRALQLHSRRQEIAHEPPTSYANLQ